MTQSELFDEDVTLEVSVMTPATMKVSRAGKKFAELIVKMVKAPYDTVKMMAFDHAANAARELKVSDRVTVTGKSRKDGDRLLLFIRGIFREGEKPVAAQESPNYILAQDCGGLDEYRKSRDRAILANRRRGLVPLISPSPDGRFSLMRFDREENCVEVNGKWVQKIQFVMEKIGSATVNRELIAAGIGKSVQACTPQGKPVEWVSKYRQWLDRKVAELTGKAIPAENLFD